MSRAINVSATRSAPIRHHCGRHAGGGKDRSQKQTQVAPVPPSQSSANLHFFSLRTHTKSAYFKTCPKNILSEVSRMNKHKEGQGQEYEYVILDRLQRPSLVSAGATKPEGAEQQSPNGHRQGQTSSGTHLSGPQPPFL